VPEKAGPVEDAQARAAWDALPAEDQAAVTWMYANVGKAIAAYERRLLPGASRFDAYVEALLSGSSSDVLNADEVAGLRLFIGRANCTVCHMGPLFTSHEFQNTGVPGRSDLPPDNGRLSGAEKVQNDEFNCLSHYSDALAEECTTLRFMKVAGHEMERQYKVPSLRNVGERTALMHAGQFASIAQALEHYNRAPHAESGHSELKPLNLSPAEMRQLEAFLRSLSGGISAPAETVALGGR
jgi:cytochrome c peroxidase